MLSGYFVPLPLDHCGNPLHRVDPFGKNKRARQHNTPLDQLRTLPLNVQLPQFWLGPGAPITPT